MNSAMELIRTVRELGLSKSRYGELNRDSLFFSFFLKRTGIMLQYVPGVRNTQTI